MAPGMLLSEPPAPVGALRPEVQAVLGAIRDAAPSSTLADEWRGAGMLRSKRVKLGDDQEVAEL